MKHLARVVSLISAICLGGMILSIGIGRMVPYHGPAPAQEGIAWSSN